MPSPPPPIAFNVDDAQHASDTWKFSCGPAAVCAVTGMTPAQLRPHMGDFERKGYTNPTLMWEVLRTIGVRFRKLVVNVDRQPWPRFGLVRVQWGGPWTRPGVPMAARYRHTHWVASCSAVWPRPEQVFDVNATCVGGWLPFTEWSEQLVPWLLKECEPKADGMWWITHAVEVERG